MKALVLCAAAVFAASADAADFNVYKCTAPGGAVTYQPVPCPPASAEKRIDLLPFSAGYDPSEGGKVFEREADMDKRRAEAAQAEAAAGEQVAMEDAKRIGKAHAPVLPTEASNEGKHQPFVAGGPARRR